MQYSTLLLTRMVPVKQVSVTWKDNHKQCTINHYDSEIILSKSQSPRVCKKNQAWELSWQDTTSKGTHYADLAALYRAIPLAAPFGCWHGAGVILGALLLCQNAPCVEEVATHPLKLQFRMYTHVKTGAFYRLLNEEDQPKHDRSAQNKGLLTLKALPLERRLIRQGLSRWEALPVLSSLWATGVSCVNKTFQMMNNWHD